MEQIKVGDIVRVSEDIPQSCDIIPTKREFTVTAVGKEFSEIRLNGALLPTYFVSPTKYLIKINAEAKEPTIKVGDSFKSELGNGVVTQVDDMCIIVLLDNGWNIGITFPEPKERPDNTIAIPAEADLTDSFWIAYEADLAKEIAVKLAGSTNFSYAKDKAAYVVEYAREIVENLKKSKE